MIELDNPEEFINRRRRQIHVHSVIYYYLHCNIIDDHTFDKWAVELANAQKEYPQFKHTGYMPQVFDGFTGDTGMHLPVTERVLALAHGMLRYAEEKSQTITPVQKKTAQKPAESKWQGDVGYAVN